MSEPDSNIKLRLRRIWYFFPFQLVWVHLKKNHLLLLFWVILFGYILQQFSIKYGIPYLFLYPEYMGNVNFLSHYILGFSVGGFIMAFNISSYILNGFRFPFIATLNRPFLKYCYNNFIISGWFLLTYIYQLIMFQTTVEFVSPGVAILNTLGLVVGAGTFVGISFCYFLITNKNLFRMFDIKEGHHQPKTKREQRKQDLKEKPVKGFFIKSIRWNQLFTREREWTVETYLKNPLQIALARESDHYDKDMLRKVFRQNHMNASFFEMAVIVTILVLGLFRELPFFQIPAGASVLLLFTMLLMLSSALHSWLKGWTTLAGIGLLLILNVLSQYETFQYTNYAYGLNYETEPVVLNSPMLVDHNEEEIRESDLQHGHFILNNWKAKNYSGEEIKPKLVLLNASGGGLRSAMWTTLVMQHADSVTNGKFMKQCHLISGASGGMIGAAYMREVYAQQADFHDPEHMSMIGRDVLNPVAFAVTVNDLVIRFQHFEDGDYSYTKDRGYAFEKQLNTNTGGLLNKRLRDYREAEEQSEIPMMVLSPTVMHDGSRLLISPQPVSYLQKEDGYKGISGLYEESIEFTRLFKEQDADNLWFTTALRMNASFPYITPSVGLPSDPPIHVMDAGIRDNIGTSISIRFMHAFKQWIRQNTSGVVIVQIRDKGQDQLVEGKKRTILQDFISPVGSFYNNWPSIQNYDQQQLLTYANSWMGVPIDVVTFELWKSDEDPISLSWHLTSKEKKRIEGAINTEHNTVSLNKLQTLLGPEFTQPEKLLTTRH